MTFSIETDFPGGNACDISIEESDDGTRIAFAPDPRGGTETLWFYLKVLRAGADAPRHLELELKHSANMLGAGAPQALRPVLRYAEGDWERLPAPNIAQLPDGRPRVLWQIAPPATSVEMAVCFPYGEEELETLLRETGDYWKRDTIGVGQRSTPLPRLANDYGHLESERRGLYIVARQHAGETPGSWVLDGFLRQLAKSGDSAPLTWVAPLADADGVRFGDYGKDQFPYDLNRAWAGKAMRHEALVIRRDAQRWSERCCPWLALDFHAPGACETDGIYAHVDKSEAESERYPLLHETLEAMNQALTPRFASPKFERIAKRRSRWETPQFSEFMAEGFNIPCALLEVPYAQCDGKVLMREDYREAGVRLAGAIVALQEE